MERPDTCHASTDGSIDSLGNENAFQMIRSVQESLHDRLDVVHAWAAVASVVGGTCAVQGPRQQDDLSRKEGQLGNWTGQLALSKGGHSPLHLYPWRLRLGFLG